MNKDINSVDMESATLTQEDNSVNTGEILKGILEQFGLQIVRDQKRLKALFLDYRLDKKELNLLMTILQSMAFNDILISGKTYLTDYEKSRLLANIQNEYPFDEKYLKLGLNWWFYALSGVNGKSSLSDETGEDIRLKLADDYFDNENYSEAYELFMDLAGEGYPEAENKLGVMYRFGLGVTKDYDEAADWFKKSSKAAYHDGQYNLATMYQFGYGVPIDYEKAFELYEKAYENGSIRAVTSLAVMYEKGLSVQKDLNKASELYKLAAEQGDTEAQTSLAFLYCEGRGVPKDYKEAFKLYSMAAKSGDPLAKKGLGFMYENGLGVTRSYNEALKWYRKANEKE